MAIKDRTKTSGDLTQAGSSSITGASIAKPTTIIDPAVYTGESDGDDDGDLQPVYGSKTVADYSPTNYAQAADQTGDYAKLTALENQGRPTSDALTALESQSRPTLADSGERPTSEKLTALEEQSRPTYTGSYDEQISQLLNDIYNRGTFTYNYNEDPLYQQYAESYTQNAKKAMKDSQAAAAALTGGYGSTYATQAGQQAYDSYMQQLSNEIPTLYQLAADRYDTETSNLNNKLSTFNNQDATDYSRYRDQNTDYETDRNYYYNKWLADNSNYDTDRTYDYNKWVAENSNYDTDRNYAYNKWAAENSNYDTDLNYAYNKWLADQAQNNYLTELYQTYNKLDPNYEEKTVRTLLGYK